jgi:hypothetical protein
MADYNKISHKTKDQLLAVFEHYMSQDMRQKLMLECPTAYNEWMGADIVKVVRVEGNTQVDPKCSWVDCVDCGTPYYKHRDDAEGLCINCRFPIPASDR